MKCCQGQKDYQIQPDGSLKVFNFGTRYQLTFSFICEDGTFSTVMVCNFKIMSNCCKIIIQVVYAVCIYCDSNTLIIYNTYVMNYNKCVRCVLIYHIVYTCVIVLYDCSFGEQVLLFCCASVKFVVTLL